MFKEHPVFIPPIDTNQIIWRYIDFTKLVDLLNTHCLFFTQAEYFEDIFEGSLTKETVKARSKQFDELMKNGKLNKKYTLDFWQKSGEDSKKEMAINCWHMNNYESAAMWKLYLKSNEGIAIQSTYSRLIESLNENEVSINVGTVTYVDYEKDFIPYGNGFSAYVHKRKSFEHERELRCIIWQVAGDNIDKVNFEQGGVKIKVNLEKLIENIFVSPDSPPWLTELVIDVVKKFGINVTVTNSRLNDKPIY